MRFRRSEGLTESEQLLAGLCDDSFLRLWTYPNLYKKRAKELIDVLVVFGDDVILFSDKSCVFTDSGDPDVDWSRWYRKSIAKSAHQIDQAERWIRSYPNQVFLDANCTERLPIALPLPEKMRVHRVCVALGALDRAAAETGRRSLVVRPAATNGTEGFTIGRIDQARGWVHVFDEDALSVLLKELSTTPDFIHYLNSKMRLFDEGRFVRADAETDLLAYYLWNNRAFPFRTPIRSLASSLLKAAFRLDGSLRTSFVWNFQKFPPVAPRVRLQPDLWKKVETSPEFLRGRAENKVSEFWDNLIGYVIELYLEEDLEFGNEIEMSDYERLVRLMAGETRFFRRILTKAILERADRARENAISTMLPSSQDDVNYVLYIGRGDQGGDHNAYRAARMEELRRRCHAAKGVHPDRRWIVGMAFDASGVKGSSEDFIVLDTRNWTPEVIRAAETLRRELGYFIPGKSVQSRINEEEYPQD
jgi:hypothetical protein